MTSYKYYYLIYVMFLLIFSCVFNLKLSYNLLGLFFTIY